MSRLTEYAVENPTVPLMDTSHAGLIADLLSDLRVRFERWPAERELALAAPAEILQLYATEVARLKESGGYRTADVVSVTPDSPNVPALRSKFRDEHTHAEDEVRFFVNGKGAFYLRNGDRVVRVICERGDLLSVPAGLRHWFDMGPSPVFTAIRLFTNEAGWIPAFTGSGVAASIPALDE